jgi:uncharacterized protein
VRRIDTCPIDTYNIHTVEVEWDPRKAAANYRKHRVLFADAATVLDDPHGLTVEDRRFGEQRFVTVGSDALGRVLVVVYAYPTILCQK